MRKSIDAIAVSPKFQAILDASLRSIETTGGIPHDTFWNEVEAESREAVMVEKPAKRSKRASRKAKV